MRITERCAHPQCGFENRAEYCQPIAANPDDTVSLVIEKLDDLLSESGDVSSTSYTSTWSEDVNRVSREFSYLHGNFLTWVWPIEETSVAIHYNREHQPRRESYSIAVSWIVRQAMVNDTPVTTAYGIEVYPSGLTQAYVEQRLVMPYEKGVQVRPMTTYDLHQLYTSLDHVSNLHVAEIADNARRDAVS